MVRFSMGSQRMGAREGQIRFPPAAAQGAGKSPAAVTKAGTLPRIAAFGRPSRGAAGQFSARPVEERLIMYRAFQKRRPAGACARAVLVSLTLLVAAPTSARPQTQPAAAEAEDGQWTMPGKNYALTRYSGLDQINTENVKNLQVAWTFSTGVNRGQEAAPLVVGDTMYVVTPFPNILYALDLNKKGAMKWKYEPKPARGGAGRRLLRRGQPRLLLRRRQDLLQHARRPHRRGRRQDRQGGVEDQGRRDQPRRDDDDGAAGREGQGARRQQRRRIRRARAGSRRSTPTTGKIAWTAYSSGPDAECLIGPELQAVLRRCKLDKAGKDLGVTTWPPDHWKIGGGTVWGWVSYDPELNLIYHGTGNPGSWNPELRPGDNKWSCGVFARDPDTGQAAWYYQYNPHDLFDHDGINEHILLDLHRSTASRARSSVHPDRNGYIYVIDRKTGEVLSATPFVRNTANKGVDLKTGRLSRTRRSSRRSAR